MKFSVETFQVYTGAKIEIRGRNEEKVLRKVTYMTFDEYQKKSRRTAYYPGAGSNFVYPVLGLVGESGEVAEKIKKVLRDEQGEITQEKIAELSKELGDVLWYIAQIATELGLSFEDIAATNLEKLAFRLERNKLSGSGDNR